MSTEENKSLIEFPCDFPIKIMGKDNDDFRQVVQAVLAKHVELDGVDFVYRPSSKGSYLSITATISVSSQEQLDAIYSGLTSEESIRYVL